MNYTNRNTNLDIYFAEIKKAQTLTKEDEIILFDRIKKGDKKAETEIFNRLAKLAVAVAKTYTGEAELLEDLIQEANYGILIAIPKFDASKGYRFSSYARWWMKATIGDFLDSMDVVRRKDKNIEEKVKKIRRDYYNENHCDPTEYEILDILEEQGVMVTDMSALSDLCFCRLDLPMDTEDGSGVMSEEGQLALEVSSRNEFENEVDDEYLKEILNEKMSILDDRERKFVAMKYGLDGYSEMEYDVIADRESETKKITSERVRQIVTGAVKKMQAHA